MEQEKFITGDKFVEMADYTFAPLIRHRDDYSKLQNTLNVRGLINGDVIYTHTMYVDELFRILEGVDVYVKVITHNSDINIQDRVIPECVIKWYAQNVCTMDERVVPIPIGLENSRWFPELHKMGRIADAMNRPKEYKNLVYLNHNISTNPSKRAEPYLALDGKSFVTSMHGVNGIGFGEYLYDLCRHKFVICPEGNGVDTHRFWEAQYVGAIPIVKISVIAERLYTYFPCMVVDNWGEITEDRLNNEFAKTEDIKQFYDHTEMLTFKYWRDKIYSE